MSVRSRVKPARCAAASAALEPDVPLPKGKGTARACGRRSRALPRLRESVNREFNIMTNKSSIHFAKCRPGGQPERHNFRQYSTDDFRPKYFLPEAEQQPNIYKDLLEADTTAPAEAGAAEDHARRYYDDVRSHYTGRGKRPKYENCRKEAILNLSETSTEADVMNVVKYLEEKWHLKTTSYAIHRDEGYKDQDGTVHRNLHAHLVLDSLYLDKNGKPKQAWRHIKIGDLRTIQDDVAKIMHMERTRGQGRGRARAHLDRETYKTVKIQQDAAEHQRRQAEQATKAAALETAKAQAATEAAALEAERAAQEKAEATKQAEETARQREQIDHDIEVHKLHPTGLLVNRALRDANAAQAAEIDKLHQQAQWTAAKHKSDLADKDRQITEAREETDAKRQTIKQLRAALDESQQTIKRQQDEITATRAAAMMYAEMQEYWQTRIPEQDAVRLHAEAFGIIQKAIHKINETLKAAGVNLMQKIITGIQEELHPEQKRLENEKAARLEAERRQAEAKKSQSRGYGR